MEKKETQKKNTSSGVEKVERIEKSKQAGVKRVKKTTATKEAAMGGDALQSNAEKESQAAKERVDAAIARKKKQEERKAARKEKAAKKAAERKKKRAEKKALIEKRAAEKKAREEKRAAAKKASIEKRKAEKEEKLQKRARAKANRNNERYKAKKEKSKRKNRPAGERRERGYGGWIAAVVSLGVVSLALATTVTVGAIEMNKGNQTMMSSYRGTMYELTGIMENLDNDLDRVRISNSPAQQSRILTDLLVQARLAELDLEKLPVSAEIDRNVTAFINRTATACEGMLSKLRRGGELSTQDKQLLEKLYETNHTVRTELDDMLAKMTDKDLGAWIKKGEGSMREALERVEQATLAENSHDLRAPKGIEEKPAEGKGRERGHIEAAVAEGMCNDYFAGYSISEFQCVGETVARGYAAYNIQGYDEKGNQLFAEVSQEDGTLLRFDYYEDCMGETFDIRNAQLIAEEFLQKLGYDDMEVVRLRNNDGVTDFTFVYESDGVAYYPDEVRVKVCRTRGVVSGFDATKYVLHHKDRGEVEVNVTLAEAYAKLYEGLEVQASRLAVIQTIRGERTAYEFLCGYGEENYFVFLDATSGEELSIVNVKSIA